MRLKERKKKKKGRGGKKRERGDRNNTNSNVGLLSDSVLDADLGGRKKKGKKKRVEGEKMRSPVVDVSPATSRSCLVPSGVCKRKRKEGEGEKGGGIDLDGWVWPKGR